MRIQRALSASVFLLLGCAKAPGTSATREASRRPLTVQEEAFRRVLAHGCTGFKECDDLYIKTRRRAAECSQISSDCSREREDLATATAIRDAGFERAVQEDYRHQFVLAGEEFRRVLALGCPDGTYCGVLVVQAQSRVTQCAELALDCTRDRENEITAAALMDAELKCRATPACIGARLAKLVCEAKDEKREALKTLTEDERKPSSEVDWLTHNGLVTDLPEYDEAITNLQTRYAAATHESFNDTLCGATKGR